MTHTRTGWWFLFRWRYQISLSGARQPANNHTRQHHYIHELYRVVKVLLLSGHNGDFVCVCVGPLLLKFCFCYHLWPENVCVCVAPLVYLQYYYCIIFLNNLFLIFPIWFYSIIIPLSHSKLNKVGSTSERNNDNTSTTTTASTTTPTLTTKCQKETDDTCRLKNQNGVKWCQ